MMDKDVQDEAWIKARIELFRAVVAHEHAALRPLFLLNGGAAVAALAFIGQVWPADVSGVIVAMVIWCVGLFAAGLAAGLAYFSQNAFYKESGHRQSAKEAEEDGDTAKKRDEWEKHDTQAKRGQNCRLFAQLLGAISLTCFIGGAIWSVTNLPEPIVAEHQITEPQTAPSAVPSNSASAPWRQLGKTAYNVGFWPCTLPFSPIRPRPDPQGGAPVGSLSAAEKPMQPLQIVLQRPIPCPRALRTCGNVSDDVSPPAMRVGSADGRLEDERLGGRG